MCAYQIEVDIVDRLPEQLGEFLNDFLCNLSVTFSHVLVGKAKLGPFHSIQTPTGETETLFDKANIGGDMRDCVSR